MTRRISRRVDRTWKRLGSWYGTRLTEQYGEHASEDWADLIDRTDDERLEDALLKVRRDSPIHPPTLGQLEAAIPRKEAQGPNVPSRAQRAAELMLATHGQELCAHQLRSPWSYFGPVQEFTNKQSQVVSHPLVRGVQVGPCEQCGLPSYRVLLSDDLVVAA